MEELGINLVQIISYVVIFLLLYYFTRRFLKRVLDNIEKRKKIIEEGIRNAVKAQELKEEKLKEAEEEKKEILRKAFIESEDILAKAKSQAESILEKAKQEKEIVLSNAQKEIENLRDQATLEGLSRANEIITLAIQKVFEDVQLSDEDHARIIQQALEKIRK